MVEVIHLGLRWTHIVFGFVGLLIFWAPIFLKKGGDYHVRLGRVFVWCARVVGFSALLSCGWALSSPESFLGVRSDGSAWSADMISGVRFFFAILGGLSLALLSSVYIGVDVLRERKSPQKLDSTKLAVLHWTQAIAAVMLITNGAMNLSSINGGRYGVHVGLGLLLLFDFVDARRFVKRPFPTPMAWWYRHMDGMIGGGIAFHTAFAVFGFSRLIGIGPVEGPLVFLPWVLPAAIGVPATNIWIRRYKRKFGELDSAELGGPKPART